MQGINKSSNEHALTKYIKSIDQPTIDQSIKQSTENQGWLNWYRPNDIKCVCCWVKTKG